MDLRRCGTCACWSQLVAEARGGGPLRALCEHPTGPKTMRMTTAGDTCLSWSNNAPAPSGARDTQGRASGEDAGAAESEGRA
jgi:hypothetical protein